jgi:hypothetical protein
MFRGREKRRDFHEGHGVSGVRVATVALLGSVRKKLVLATRPRAAERERHYKGLRSKRRKVKDNGLIRAI